MPPDGLQRVLARAAADPAFRDELVTWRSGAAKEAGIALTESERNVLDGMPAAQLDLMIRHLPPTVPPPQPMRDDFAPGGIRPDLEPSPRPRPTSFDDGLGEITPDHTAPAPPRSPLRAPPDFRPRAPAQGIPVTLARAADDEAFRADLLARRSEASIAAGIELTENERKVLDTAPRDGLEEMIRNVPPPRPAPSDVVTRETPPVADDRPPSPSVLSIALGGIRPDFPPAPRPLPQEPARTAWRKLWLVLAVAVVAVAVVSAAVVLLD